MGVRFYKSTETKVARSQGSQTIPPKGTLEQLVLLIEPGTLLNPLNAHVDGN